MVHKEIYIELQDTQWQFDYIDHDRNIARAIVYDENGIFYFVRAERDDDFGKQHLGRDVTPCRFACDFPCPAQW